jgi:hypothetical protein
LLSAVRTPRLWTGLALGTIAAAATAGALAGFGVRQGTPARPFNVLAYVVLGDRAAGTWGFDPVVTVVGVLLHSIVVCAYGLLFVLLLGIVRGRRLWISAGVFAAVVYAVGLFFGPRLFGGVISTVLQPIQVVALHIVLAAALAGGMRFALFDRYAD